MRRHTCTLAVAVGCARGDFEIHTSGTIRASLGMLGEARNKGLSEPAFLRYGSDLTRMRT